MTHWALPLAAAFLPWHAGYALLARATRTMRQHDAIEIDAHANARCLSEALSIIPATRDRDAWIRDWRLVQLVDRTDLFLSSSRSSRWWRRQVDVDGRWPDSGPFLALTAHWGAGLFALRHMRGAGHRARFLLLRVERPATGTDRAHLAYGRARIREVERATAAPVIYTGGAVDEITGAWNEGTPVIALCDAPPTPGRSTIASNVEGVHVTMPAGLIRLACERRIPVVLFAAGIDRASGRRRLDIAKPVVHAQTQTMADALAAWLVALIAKDSAAWHLWPYASTLLSARTDVRVSIET